MNENSLTYTAQNLGKFLAEFFHNDQMMRLGQAACYVFQDLPKPIQDSIFYEEDMKYVGKVLWEGLFID